MKIIITGGAGFIGCNIAREFVRRRQQVKIIDNLSTGKLKNIADLKNKIQFVKGDIKNFRLLKREFKGYDAVLHQAAFVSVPKSMRAPKQCFDDNVSGTKNVLDAAVENSIKRVVFASSCAVYGGIRPNTKAKENKKPNPQSPYAESKLLGERLCKQYGKKYGIRTIILRYFNVYGPGQALHTGYANVIPTFIDALRRGSKPIIYGTGNQVRDFVHVDDVVRANLLALKATDDLAGEIFNIAGQVCTIKQLLNIIQKQMLNIQYPISNIQCPKRPGDIFYIASDHAKAEKLLGFKPQINIKQGLRKYVKWFKTASSKL